MGKMIQEADNESEVESLEQDNYWELMDQLHPLRGAEMADIFPVLAYFKNEDKAQIEEDFFDEANLERLSKLKTRDKKSFKDRQSMRISMKKQRTLIEKAIELGTGTVKQLEDYTIKSKLVKNSEKVLKNIHSSDDPLKELGPGISTYHQLLVMLFALFFVLTILHIPLINQFRSYNFYDKDSDGIIAKFSLGNLGFSQTNCDAFSMIKGNTGILKCNSGYISELVDWGIISHFEDKMQCQRKQENICTPLLNDKLVREKYNDICKGKAECSLTDFESFVISKTLSKNKI